MMQTFGSVCEVAAPEAKSAVSDQNQRWCKRLVQSVKWRHRRQSLLSPTASW